MFTSEHWREMLRYGSVGAGLVVVEYSLFLLGLNLHLASPPMVNMVARLCGGALGYLLHATFTFRATARRPSRAARYVFLVLANAVLASVFLALLDRLIPTLAAKIASDGAVIIIGYLGSRFLVFSQR